MSAAFNPKRSEELNLTAMLAKQWETDTKHLMTGQQGIDKMKEILTADGTMPFDERSVPPEWQDALLLRFWVGFKKNCANAAEAFKKMLEWRKENSINDIRDKILGGLKPEQFPRYEQLRRFYPLLKTGFDKNGCPINITLTGLIDPAKLVQTATTEEIRMYIVYEMEYKLVQLCKLTQETGIVYRALEVHDLKVASLSTHSAHLPPEHAPLGLDPPATSRDLSPPRSPRASARARAPPWRVGEAFCDEPHSAV